MAIGHGTQPSVTKRRLVQRGTIMIEVLVAIGILGTAMLAALTSISTATKVTTRVSNEASLEWVAISQVDTIRAASFRPSGTPYANVQAPAGYSVDNTTTTFGGSPDLQLVVVSVTSPEGNQYVTRFLKTNR